MSLLGPRHACSTLHSVPSSGFLLSLSLHLFSFRNISLLIINLFSFIPSLSTSLFLPFSFHLLPHHSVTLRDPCNSRLRLLDLVFNHNLLVKVKAPLLQWRIFIPLALRLLLSVTCCAVNECHQDCVFSKLSISIKVKSVAHMISLSQKYLLLK